MKMKMIEKYKPDFEKSYVAANNILVSSDVLTMFPFKTKDILKMEDNIICCSYKKAKKYNVNIEDFGSKSAVLIKQGDNKIIFYNEEELIARIRFSILHEYGHYKLQHDLDTKDEEMYKKFEVETNYFAAQLLMPEQLIRELQARGKRITKEFLIELFEVSEMAAQKRINTLNKNQGITIVLTINVSTVKKVILSALWCSKWQAQIKNSRIPCKTSNLT